MSRRRRRFATSLASERASAIYLRAGWRDLPASEIVNARARLERLREEQCSDIVTSSSVSIWQIQAASVVVWDELELKLFKFCPFASSQLVVSAATAALATLSKSNLAALRI